VYLWEGKTKLATPECSKSIQAVTTEAESFLRANGVSTRREIVAGGLKIFFSLKPQHSERSPPWWERTYRKMPHATVPCTYQPVKAEALSRRALRRRAIRPAVEGLEVCEAVTSNCAIDRRILDAFEKPFPRGFTCIGSARTFWKVRAATSKFSQVPSPLWDDEATDLRLCIRHTTKYFFYFPGFLLTILHHLSILTDFNSSYNPVPTWLLKLNTTTD
jgi:hypothetical protein